MSGSSWGRVGVWSRLLSPRPDEGGMMTTERCAESLRSRGGRDNVCGRQLGHTGKHLSEYVWANHLQRAHDWNVAHPENHKASKRKHYNNNKRYFRNKHLMRSFGITIEEFERMWEEQGGLCAACGIEPPRDVDHDHDTGTIRGLLCQRCNVTAGQANDDPVRLRAVANYLER